MLGLKLSDADDNRSAGLWLLVLILTLTSTLPVVFFDSPSLAFRRSSPIRFRADALYRTPSVPAPLIGHIVSFNENENVVPKSIE